MPRHRKTSACSVYVMSGDASQPTITWTPRSESPGLSCAKGATESDWRQAELLLQRNSKTNGRGASHWTGFLLQGYGRVRWRGRMYCAHALSYMVANGRAECIPAGMVVRHKCRVRACIASDHLELGSPSQNMADKIRDGTNMSGEKHPNARINREKANQIRLSKGEGTVKERAARFGVTWMTVAGIDAGTTWNPPGESPRPKVGKSKNERPSPSQSDYAKWLRKLESKSVVTPLSDTESHLDTPHWIYSGCKDKAGYGVVSLNGMQRPAHRAALEASLGTPLGEREHTRHKCRRRDCCRPDHLEPGSARDNALDRRRRTAPLGEKCATSKLLDRDRAEIARRFGEGETTTDLSTKYGVSVRTIYRCIRAVGPTEEVGAGRRIADAARSAELERRYATGNPQRHWRQSMAYRFAPCTGGSEVFEPSAASARRLGKSGRHHR